MRRLVALVGGVVAASMVLYLAVDDDGRGGRGGNAVRVDALPQPLQRYLSYVGDLQTLDVRGVRVIRWRNLGTVAEVRALADRVFAERAARLDSQFGGRRRRSAAALEAFKRLERQRDEYIARRTETEKTFVTPFAIRIRGERERLDIGMPPTLAVDGSGRIARQTRIFAGGTLSDLITSISANVRTYTWPGPDVRQQEGHLAHLSLPPVIRWWPIGDSSAVDGGHRYVFKRLPTAEPLVGCYGRCSSVMAVFSTADGLPVRIELFGEKGLLASADIGDYTEWYEGVIWPHEIIWNHYDEGLRPGERACMYTMHIQYHVVESNVDIPDWVFKDPHLAEPDEELFPTFFLPSPDNGVR